jgi:iron complex transport system ATP-binding protein
MALMLEIDRLSVVYGARTILRDVSLDLHAGQVIALIGPNGAGKSTLVRAVSGVAPLHSGQIRLAGQRLSALSPAQRARLMAVVPQARNLPPAFTAWETVLLGRTPHLNWLGQTSAQDEARAHQAMERTDTLSLADRPMGELSGGEQQRVMLARALAQSAPLLLLDEPTAHLDLQYQVSLLDLAADLAHHDGYAVLLVLHDLNLVSRFANRVALLVRGELQAFGLPDDVLQAETLSRAYQLPLHIIASPADGQRLITPAM